MPLVDTGLIVRYYIDEAASGQGPTAVLDGSGVDVDFDLVITYTTNFLYTEISGNRGINFPSTNGVQRADKAIDNTSDKVRGNIYGSKTYTVEVVAQIDDFSSSTGRCFAINKGTSNPTLGLTGTSGTNANIYFNESLMRSFNPGSVRAVWHIVVDTALATANDRIKIYKDGTLQSPTIDANPSQNVTVSIPSDSRLFMFNRGDSSFERSMDGVLFYAALYSSAFSAANVTTNEAILSSDDDTPVAGAGQPAHRRWEQVKHMGGLRIS